MMRKTIAIAILAYLQFSIAEAQGSKGRPSQYKCPGDNGLKYTTPQPNAITYELKCGQGTTAKRIDDTPKNSQKECADFCSEHPQCQSADYSWDTKNCGRFSEYIPTISMAGVNTWFPTEERKRIEPKPDPQPRTPPSCPAVSKSIIETVANSNSYTNDARCPEEDNKIFITAGGNYMKTRCAAHISGTLFASQPLSSLSECLNYCSDTPGCNSASWEGGRSTWLCRLYAEGEEAAVPCDSKNHDMAYKIDPPVYEAEDDAVILCSTECPLANGQTWNSPNGVKFHMDCCKRHGVKAFAKDHFPTFKACMTACGTVPACQSVDWQEETGICYFGKHSGEPTISVAGWSSAHSLGCAGACDEGCGGCGGKQKGSENGAGIGSRDEL